MLLCTSESGKSDLILDHGHISKGRLPRLVSSRREFDLFLAAENFFGFFLGFFGGLDPQFDILDTMDSGFFTSPSGSPVDDTGSSAEIQNSRSDYNLDSAAGRKQDEMVCMIEAISIHFTNGTSENDQ